MFRGGFMSVMSDGFANMTRKVLSADFFNGGGAGGDLPYYIYHYAPEQEQELRSLLPYFIKNIHVNSGKNILKVDLLELIIDQFKNISDLEAVYELQQNDPDVLLSMVNVDRLASAIRSKKDEIDADLIIITGVGKVYPMLRTHNLLNVLHSEIDNMPVIMFFPGDYSGAALKLFGILPESNYYRAFKI